MDLSLLSKIGRCSARALRLACGVVLVLTAMSGTAYAVDIVPEIDPGSLVSAATLLIGGGLLATDRFRRKK